MLHFQHHPVRLPVGSDPQVAAPVGSDVMLSTGEMARVVENLSYAVLRPKVLGLQSGKVYDLANDVKCANIIIL